MLAIMQWYVDVSSVSVVVWHTTELCVKLHRTFSFPLTASMINSHQHCKSTLDFRSPEQCKVSVILYIYEMAQLSVDSGFCI